MIREEENTPSTPTDPASDAQEGLDETTNNLQPNVDKSSRRDLPPDNVLAFADDADPIAEGSVPSDGDGSTASVDVASETTLKFDERVTRDTLQESISEAVSHFCSIQVTA